MSRPAILGLVAVATAALAHALPAAELKLDASAEVRGPVRDRQKGVWRYTVTSQFQQGPHEIEVLLPDAFDRGRAYRVLYVLPVEKGIGGRYGDGLMELKKIDAHNQHDLICVAMAFGSVPWYMDHAEDTSLRHESYLLHVVVPLVESRYPTPKSARGRLLLGFSKSGWGAFTLLLRHPDVFGRAAAWDSPLMLREQDWRNWGIGTAAGTVETFRRYQPTRLLRARARQFQDRPRFALLGHMNFGTQGGTGYTGRNAHTIGTHKLMQSLGIRHLYNNDIKVGHAWGTGWVKPAVDALISLDEAKE